MGSYSKLGLSGDADYAIVNLCASPQEYCTVLLEKAIHSNLLPPLRRFFS